MEFLAEYALKPEVKSTIKRAMWRRMSRRPGSSLCIQGRLILAVLVMLVTAGGCVRAESDASTPLQATTPTPQAGAIPTQTTSSTYRLQPYDLIDVDVFSEEDF